MLIKEYNFENKIRWNVGWNLIETLVGDMENSFFFYGTSVAQPFHPVILRSPQCDEGCFSPVGPEASKFGKISTASPATV